MHHVHISTGALFIIALLFFGLIVAMICAIYSRKNRRDEIALERERLNSPKAAYSNPYTGGPGQIGWSAPPTPAQAMAPAYAASAGSGGGDMMMGVMLGSMLGGNHTTVIREEAPAYDAPAPSDPTPDSGGIDISWGSSDSGSSDSSFGGC